MRLGVLIEGQEGLTWDRWRQIVDAAERLGFESLWRSDHLMSQIDGQRESLETWTSLTLAAAQTTRLRFGPLVCPITFRHPSLLARMAAAVDQLSAGRLVLGLGVGWNKREHQVFGLPFPALPERADRLEEGIQVVRKLLADEPAHFSGRYYQLDGANPRPKAFGGTIPLLIGGTGERRTLPIVARYADEWDVPGGLSPQTYGLKRQRLDELCHSIGRDPGTIRRCASTAYLIARTDAELRRRSDALVRLTPDLAGLDTSAIPATLEAAGWLVGTPARFVEHLRALAAEGVERVIFQHNDQADFDALELLAREVMPLVAD